MSDREDLMYFRFLIISAIAIFNTANVTASSSFEYGGYLKNFSTAVKLPRYLNLDRRSEIPMLGSVRNRIRLDGRLILSPRLSIEAAYDLMGDVRDKELFYVESAISTIDPSAYRAIDTDKLIYPKDNSDVRSFAALHNIDRMVATIQTKDFDFYLGRQAIAWGSAKVLNPTDILAPYAYNELDTEDRIGVDAIRVRHPIGLLGEADIGVVFGDEFRSDQSAFFVRSRLYYKKTDLSFVLAGFRENLMLGVDASRAVGGAGTWIEAAFVFADALTDSGINSNDSYIRLTIGGDYSPTGGVYCFSEYHFNQPGKTDASKYLTVVNTTAYRDGAVYLLGQHYLAAGISYQVTPLITANLEWLTNLTDPSAIISPRFEYNVAENVYVSIGGYIGIGAGPDLDPTDSRSFRAVSEFGLYSDVYYMSTSIYF
jgi:hypothetical protein